jgi:hypothetical protein
MRGRGGGNEKKEKAKNHKMDGCSSKKKFPSFIRNMARTVFSCKTDGGADGGAEGGDIGGRRVVAGRRHDVDLVPF